MADNKKYLLEYSEWLDSEITQRYRTGQGQMRKQRGRNALAETPQVEVAGYEYSGQFKVVWNGTGSVKIIDGADPDGTLNRAGQTDIGDVPISTVSDIPENCTIYLVVKWDDNTNKYSFSLVSDLNVIEHPYGYVILAGVYGDSISQVWTGGAIYFGERYFV